MDIWYDTLFWLWLWVPVSVIIIAGLLWLWWSQRKQAREYLSLIMGLRKANDEWKKIADDALDIANRENRKAVRIIEKVINLEEEES